MVIPPPLPTTAIPSPFPTIPPPPTATRAGPPSCGTSVGNAFVSLWNDQSIYSRLGCPRNSAHTNQSAEEGFVNGFMLWREDTQQVYAIINDGTWIQGIAAPFDESRDPEYSCGPHSSPPSPRRGFSKVWCGNNTIHSKLGNATEYEAGFCMAGGGPCETFQDFNGGMMFYSQRSNRAYALMSDGTWRNR
jgi:hypothetical protein